MAQTKVTAVEVGHQKTGRVTRCASGCGTRERKIMVMAFGLFTSVARGDGIIDFPWVNLERTRFGARSGLVGESQNGENAGMKIHSQSPSSSCFCLKYHK